MRSVFVALMSSLIASTAFSAVPVVDIQDKQKSAPRPVLAASTQSLPAPQPLAEPAPLDAHYQMQLLQEEVRQLRGLVEQLNNEVRQLKQRQMDDYMDLDRRLSSGGAMPANTETVVAPGPGTSVPVATTPESQDEMQHYSVAYKLLKGGNVSESVIAFKRHIEVYPQGVFTANAHYWLGEIYLLQNKLEDARQAFVIVLDNYPDHRKAPDATFKLGKVYHLQGATDKARPLLEKAAAGSGSTAALARKYLDSNF